MNTYIQDMLVCGQPERQLKTALKTIALYLHPLWAFDHFDGSEISKQSCVLCSLTARDFLFQCGFKDVKVTTVFTVMQALQDGEVTYSLGIGKPGEKPNGPGRWPGHMVVEIPSIGLIVDTTLYQAKRPQWPDLPGMIATPTNRTGTLFDHPVMAAISTAEDKGYQFSVWWLEVGGNDGWKGSPDAERHRRRRKQVVEKLLIRFKSHLRSEEIAQRHENEA